MRNLTYEQRLKIFEYRKRQLYTKGLTPLEYEKEIQKLAFKYKV